ncbi:hypothetical protein oki361_23240 [Helicobacter pylori]
MLLKLIFLAYIINKLNANIQIPLIPIPLIIETIYTGTRSVFFSFVLFSFQLITLYFFSKNATKNIVAITKKIKPKVQIFFPLRLISLISKALRIAIIGGIIAYSIIQFPIPKIVIFRVSQSIPKNAPFIAPSIIPNKIKAA